MDGFHDRPDKTLDPADWGAFRALAHRLVDDTLDHLATLRGRAAIVDHRSRSWQTKVCL